MAIITANELPHSIPTEPLQRLFLRFLRFGCMAWGGPVAQIAMIRQELVDEERWISNERFNRVLAVYQILPGPEAHELCVYFGMLSRGRIGGLLAGLGFMLPGFVLMFLLSWVYVAYGITNTLLAGLFYGFQPAVAALIIRAVHRIGQHAISDRWLMGIAVLAAVAQILGIPFLITLLAGGASYVLIRRQHHHLGIAVGIGVFALVLIASLLGVFQPQIAAQSGTAAQAVHPSLGMLFLSGLKAGLLTFGGAYTVIPFLQQDAVINGGWMSNAMFLDGLALSGILPAPLIIFSTFVGYIGGGPLGAVALTVGIFAPAFGFTLIGHDVLERLIQHPSLAIFLEGVTAGVVGLISATSLGLLGTALRDIPSIVIFCVGLILLYRWKSKMVVPVVVLVGGLIGLILVGLR